MRSRNIVIPVVLSAFLLAVVVSWSIFEKSILSTAENQTQAVQKKPNSSGCLNEDTDASYKFENNERPLTNIIVNITDKKTEKIISFRIDNIFSTPISVDTHHCGIYVVKFFNYNTKVSKQKPEFNAEFWKYYYNGEGVKLFSVGDFSYEFRIDSPENYISLIKGYAGRDDYSIVIKDLKTLKDAFVLPIADVTKKNPNVVGDIGFYPGGWTSDGKYFWVNMFIGAEVYGFVRINTKDWIYEVFPAPKMTMSGDALNINNGMLTYGGNVAPWSGVEEIDQQIQKEALQAGQISSFYIYNLFTKKQYLVATTTDPTYYFRPQWISDTELQYELPTGEKKIYKISKR